MAEIFKTAVESLSVLETIVRPSFGPRGIDVALKTQNGSILLTNSGHLLLNSISMSHPICRVVSQQVERHIGLTGDGSKQMVIVLSEFLKCIYKNMFFSMTMHWSSELSGFSQACGYTASIMTAKLTDFLEEYSHYQHITIGNIENIRKCIRNILGTAINGKVNEAALGILIDRTVDLIFVKDNLEQDRFVNYVNNLIDQFKDVCVMDSGMSIGNTRTINGFLIKQNSIGTINSMKLGKPLKFIIVKDIFGADSVKFGTTKLDCNYTQLSSFFKSRVNIFHKIADLLESNDIDIILCSCGLPEYTKTMFGRQFFIVQHVHDEDIKRILNYFKIFPIETMSEVFSADFAWHIGALSEVNEMTIGRECYIRLCPSDKYINDHPSCQLILCSPHQSITQQYYSTILNMLKIIKMCCYHTYGSENRNIWSMKYLPSACCAELCIAEYFATEACSEPDMSLRTVYKSLSDALLEIPKLIYKNSCGVSGRFIDTQRLLQEFRSKKSNECCFSFGIDCETGEVSEPCKQGVIEAFSSKVLLITHCLQAAQQILRIDNILPSKRIKDCLKK